MSTSGLTNAAELRQTLEAYERERGLRLVQRLRGQEPEPPGPEQRRRVEFLLGPEAVQILEDSDTARTLLTAERDHLHGHLARVAARALLVESEVGLRAALWEVESADDGATAAQELARLARIDAPAERASLARRVAGRLADPIRRLVEAHQVADERVPAGTAPAGDATRQLARAFLADTQDAAAEHVRFLTRPWVRGGRCSWDTLLRALRLETLDGQCPARGRTRTIARALRGLGFEPHLDRHVRVEAFSAAQLGFRPLPLDPPGDVRIARDGRSGVVPELLAREALGTALGWSLSGAALPFEMRMPLATGPAPLVGGLLASWSADPLYQERVHQLRGSSTESLTRAHAVATLLFARLSAARVADDLSGKGVAETLELRAEGLSRALSCELPPPLAGLVWTGTRRELWEAEGRLLGLALHVGLRERYDEDCFVNPRMGDALRELCAGGNLQDPHAHLAGLDVPQGAAQRRMLELLP